MSGALPASGALDRSAYVQLSYQVHVQELNGILRLEHGNRTREFYFLGGVPIAYKTSLPEEQLSQTLVFGNLVSRSRLKKVLQRLDDNTSLEELLLKGRLLRRNQLDQHILGQLKKGIGAALHWNKGSWTFHPHPELDQVNIDLELLPRLSNLNCLWNGVKKHISVDAVMETVRTTSNNESRVKRPKQWSSSAAMENRLAGFELESPFDQISEALAGGGTPDEVISRVGDTSGNLIKLLWLLETIGLLEVEGVEADHTIKHQLENLSNPSEAPEPPVEKKPPTRKPARRKQKRQAPAASPSTSPRRQPPTSGAPPKEGPAKVLNADFQARQNSNYYQFLGLPPGASKDDIEAACKRLAQRWRSAANANLIDERSRQQAKELLGGVRQVWNLFKDDAARAGYDRKLEMGRAPRIRTETAAELDDILGDLPGQSQDVSSEEDSRSLLERGQALLESNHFQPAWQVLENARRENPSCPDTLAALGWAAYHIKHQAQLDEDPEDFLRLALTFAPQHSAALEYYARISLKKGDLERAEKFLSLLIKQRPDASWAQRELSQIRTAQARDSGRRFWRKGDDG